AGGEAIECAGVNESRLNKLEVDAADLKDGAGIFARGGGAGGPFGERGMRFPAIAVEVQGFAVRLTPAADPGEGGVAVSAVGKGAKIHRHFIERSGIEEDGPCGGTRAREVPQRDIVPGLTRALAMLREECLDQLIVKRAEGRMGFPAVAQFF